MSLIYKFTNKVNGKVYVGQTTRGFSQRLSEHYYRFNSGERNHKLYQALRKYGWDAFAKEVIFSTFTQKDLEYYEKVFIEEYDSFHNGYNMTCGDAAVSDETREKLRQAMLGRNITWVDKIMATKKARGTYKRGAAHVGAKQYFVSRQGAAPVMISSLSEFARNEGLDPSNLLKTLKSGKQHRGYTVILRLNDQSKDVHSSEWKCRVA